MTCNHNHISMVFLFCAWNHGGQFLALPQHDRRCAAYPMLPDTYLPQTKSYVTSLFILRILLTTIHEIVNYASNHVLENRNVGDARM